MKREVLGILIFLMILSAFLTVFIPISTAERDEKKGILVIESSKVSSPIKIEADEGSLNYTWEIINYDVNDSVGFQILRGDKIEEDISGESMYSGKIKVDKKGEYSFEWENKNKTRNVEIRYYIEFEKPIEEESTGCYSAIITLSIMIVTIIIWMVSFGFNKKEKK